jgi:hypothetical protein
MATYSICSVQIEMVLSEIDQIELRIIELNQEHQDLHYIMDHLVEEIQPDQLRIRRLKKRRLFIKDQIEHLKSTLIPDIDA